MRAELAEAHAALSRVVEAMDDHLYTLRVEPDGGYHTVYRGPHRDALAGGPVAGGADGDRLWESLVHPDDRDCGAGPSRGSSHGRPIELEYRLVGLDGVERIVLDRLRPRREADGTLYYDGATRDITERRRLEDELRLARSAAELRARTDELTGTYNRRHFAEIIAEALASDPDGCGLLLLDADHFKQVNDVHGHVVGRRGARRARDAGCRPSSDPSDCLARWGGEEFAVLAARCRLGRRSSSGAPSSCAPRVALRAGRRRRRERPPDDLDRRRRARAASSTRSTRSSRRPTACLYAAKRARSQPRLAARRRDRRGAGRASPRRVGVARALALVVRWAGGAPEPHAERVAELAAQIAERLGLPDALVLRCRIGGWLHDVGKVAIPRAILAKPGPLDDEEWAVMRTHPALGEEHRPRRRRGSARPPPPSAITTSATTARGTPIASPAARSRSRPASSPPPTPTPR